MIRSRSSKNSFPSNGFVKKSAAREPLFGHVSKITKIRVRTRDPEQSPRGVTTRQPCWACNKWCTKDAYKHLRTHGRSGKPSVPPKTKVVELVEHNSTMQSPHARTDGNPPIIPRQIRRSASLPADPPCPQPCIRPSHGCRARDPREPLTSLVVTCIDFGTPF